MEGSLSPRPHVFFEVEKIIGISSDGSYQVQWAPAWVSKFHLVGCEHLIQEFLLEQYEKETIPEPEMLIEMPHVSSEEEQQTKENSLINVTDYYARISKSVETVSETPLPTEELHLNSFSPDENVNCMNNASIDQLVKDVSLESVEPVIKIEDDDLPTETYDSFPSIATHAETSVPLTMDEMTETFINASTEKQGILNTRLNLSEVTSAHSEVEQEVTSAHSEVEQTWCQYCSETFSEMSALKQHLLSHSVERPYSCTQCNSMFTANNSLKRHMRLHTGEKPYTCQHCRKSFSWRSSFESHLLTHSGRKDFRCQDCGKRFAQSSNLNNHFRSCRARKHRTQSETRLDLGKQDTENYL